MRSMLFVPADSERKLAKALGSRTDGLILDLEDSVAAEKRPAARKLTAEFIASARAEGARAQLWVRINPLDGPDWAAVLAGIMAAAPACVPLPKPSSGQDVHRLSIAPGHALSRHALTDGGTQTLPIGTE